MNVVDVVYIDFIVIVCCFDGKLVLGSVDGVVYMFVKNFVVDLVFGVVIVVSWIKIFVCVDVFVI